MYIHFISKQLKIVITTDHLLSQRKRVFSEQIWFYKEVLKFGWFLYYGIKEYFTEVNIFLLYLQLWTCYQNWYPVYNESTLMLHWIPRINYNYSGIKSTIYEVDKSYNGFVHLNCYLNIHWSVSIWKAATWKLQENILIFQWS